MSDVLPDRLSQDPKSPFYNEDILKKGVGIRFNGVEKTNVWEYCISEGWVKVPAGKTLDRKGRPLLIKLKGTVEAISIRSLRLRHHRHTGKGGNHDESQNERIHSVSWKRKNFHFVD